MVLMGNPTLMLFIMRTLAVKKLEPVLKPKPKMLNSVPMRKSLSAVMAVSILLISITVVTLPLALVSRRATLFIDSGLPKCTPNEGNCRKNVLFVGNRAGLSRFDCGVRNAW